MLHTLAPNKNFFQNYPFFNPTQGLGTSDFGQYDEYQGILLALSSIPYIVRSHARQRQGTTHQRTILTSSTLKPSTTNLIINNTNTYEDPSTNTPTARKDF
eukprot:GILK01009617.1.p1 GENE.GILK01009617.1~~GILK01009617.1.p1  ORF type:complete len:101 (-),score=5.85 GILK01009617.1:682-984(-)